MADVLSRGSKGPDVKELQELLNFHLKDKPLTVDGIFGPETEKRVRAFQRLTGITVDGDVGPDTRTQLSLGAEVSIRLDLFRLVPGPNGIPFLCPFILPIQMAIDPHLGQMYGLCGFPSPIPGLRFPPIKPKEKVVQPPPTPMQPTKEDPGFSLGAVVGSGIDLGKVTKGPSSVWVDLQLTVPWPVSDKMSSTFTLGQNYDFADKSFGFTVSAKNKFKLNIVKFGEFGKLTADASVTGGYDVDVGKGHNVFAKGLVGPTLTFGKGKSALPYVSIGFGFGGKVLHDFEKGKTKAKGIKEGTLSAGWRF